MLHLTTDPLLRGTGLENNQRHYQARVEMQTCQSRKEKLLISSWFWWLGDEVLPLRVKFFSLSHNLCHLNKPFCYSCIKILSVFTSIIFHLNEQGVCVCALYTCVYVASSSVSRFCRGAGVLSLKRVRRRRWMARNWAARSDRRSWYF